MMDPVTTPHDSSSSLAKSAPKIESKTVPDSGQHFQRQMGRMSRQSAIIFGGTVFYTASNYLFKIYLARRLGPSPLGVYALGMTVVGVLSVLAVAGLPQAAARFVAAYTGTQRFDALRGFLWRALGLVAVLATGYAALMLVARFWIATKLYVAPTLAGFMWEFALIMMSGALVTLLGQILAGFQDAARRTVINNLIGNPLMILMAAVMIEMGMGLRGYLLAQILGNTVALGLLALAVWKLMPQEARLSAGTLPPLGSGVTSFCWTMFGITALEFVLGQADKIILGFYLDPHDIGVYVLAATLVAFVPVLLQSVNQIFAPMIAELHARGDHTVLGRIYQTVTKWVIGFTMPLVMVLIAFATPMLSIFGSAFEAGRGVLILGVVGQMVNVSVGSVGFLLMMSGHQRRVIQAEGVVAVVTVALNLILVPRLGMQGAAIAAAVAAAGMNLLLLWAVWRILRLSPYNSHYLRLLLPLLASGGVVWFLRTLTVSLPGWAGIALALVAGYAVFTIGALVFGLDDDDRIVAGAVWSRVQGMLPAVRN